MTFSDFWPETELVFVSNFRCWEPGGSTKHLSFALSLLNQARICNQVNISVLMTSAGCRHYGSKTTLVKTVSRNY